MSGVLTGKRFKPFLMDAPADRTTELPSAQRLTLVLRDELLTLLQEAMTKFDAEEPQPLLLLETLLRRYIDAPEQAE